MLIQPFNPAMKVIKSAICANNFRLKHDVESEEWKCFNMNLSHRSYVLIIMTFYLNRNEHDYLKYL